MSANLYTVERINYLIERVRANAEMLPRVEEAWADAARSVNTTPEELAQVQAEFRDAWRDLMQRFAWLRQFADEGQMWPDQQQKFAELSALLAASRPLLDRLELVSPEIEDSK
jgi:hypothetical protein